MQARAVVITQPGVVVLQDVTLHEPGADDVVIETEFTSISAGTERMLLAGQMPHPMLQLPVIPGYETVGRIAQIGAHVAPALMGQMVYVGGAHCYQGVNAAWGGQSSRIVVPAARVIPLEALDPRHGVMLALAATALHGVDLLDLKADSRVLVIGQGPVGQLAARIAQQRGAWVAVSDRSAARLAVSAADRIIDVESEAVTAALDAPVDVIIEAAGSMAALTDTLPQLAKGGTILLLGYYQKVDLPYMPLFLKEARLLTAKEWAPGDLLRCRDMMLEGALNVAPLLTHTLPVTEIEQAYDVAMNQHDCLKLVLEWSSPA
jgi:3-hydroxyethyl bacteriochlorophyllide a dehydrogenase